MYVHALELFAIWSEKRGNDTEKGERIVRGNYFYIMTIFPILFSFFWALRIIHKALYRTVKKCTYRVSVERGTSKWDACVHFGCCWNIFLFLRLNSNFYEKITLSMLLFHILYVYSSYFFLNLDSRESKNFSTKSILFEPQKKSHRDTHNYFSRFSFSPHSRSLAINFN
jgi:hypothetical protein